MPSQALRWACRARTLATPPLSGKLNSLRAISSTRQRLAEHDDGGKPGAAGAAGGVRARAVAAAMQINSLVKGRAELMRLRARDSSSSSSSSSSNSNSSNSNRSNSGTSNTGNSNFNKGNAPAAVGERPKVVDVKSIPRGLGRGVLRARAGTGAGASTSPAGTGTGNRFSPGNRFGPRGAGAGNKTGGGAGRKRAGGGPGGKARAKRGEERDKAGGAAGGRGKRTDPFERLDAAEQAFDDAMRFGTRAGWAPSLTLDSLSAFLPALPTAAGRGATVLQGLSALGTADPVGVPQGLQARSYAGEVEARGVRFFADVGAREAAERYLQERRREGQAQDAGGKLQDGEKGAEDQGPVIRDAEEAVRAVILERAVKGRFEEPRFAEAGDAVGLARAWHLRGGTWTTRDMVRFEQKIVPLLERYGPGAGARARASR